MTRARRWLGLVLAEAAMMAIALLTLTPQEYSTEGATAHHLCILCGGITVSDVLANMLLFAPLGATLVLAGLSWRRAAIVCTALSFGIETTQYFAVPGRYAALSDLLTNALGGALAAALMARRHAWLRPTPRAARWLTGAAAATFVGVLAGGAWALGGADDADTTPPVANWGDFSTGRGYFHGHVEQVTLGDFTTTHQGPGPVLIAAPARRDVHAEVQVSGWDGRQDFVPLLYVYRRRDARPWLILGQEGAELVLEPGLRGRQVGLRQPSVSVRKIDWQPEARLPYHFAADVSGDRLTVTVDQGTLHHGETMRLSPTLGWSLLSPYPRVNSARAPLASALWVAGLALPLGYWVRWLARGRARREIAAATCTLATLTLGLAVMPTAMGFAVARPWEWVAALGGVLLGGGAAEAMRWLVRARVDRWGLSTQPAATRRTRPSTIS